jgi:hypothetical protein
VLIEAKIVLFLSSKFFGGELALYFKVNSNSLFLQSVLAFLLLVILTIDSSSTFIVLTASPAFYDIAPAVLAMPADPATEL